MGTGWLAGLTETSWTGTAAGEPRPAAVVDRPAGLARRRKRLSDTETAERMLRAGLAKVAKTGLTVSLDHLSLEDLIRDAEVARSAVYRRWPYKDLYFSDLVRALAQSTRPAAPLPSGVVLSLVRSVVAPRLDWLAGPSRRAELLVLVLREVASADFEAIVGSVEWRTYLSLHATFLSVVSEELRADVLAALAVAEEGFVAGVTAGYARIADLFGYRVPASFGAVVSATLRGFALRFLSAPDLAAREAASGVAAVVLALLEPDPAVSFDDARVASVRRSLGL